MQIGQELEREIAAVAERSGCEVLEVEDRGGTLRVVLDRPEGVTLDDCQAVSKQVSALLDVEDFGSAKYILEVSSPGLDRKLYGPRDYRRFEGRLVRVTFRESDEVPKRTVTGRLASYRQQEGDVIELETSSGAERLVIPLSDVQRARLVPEF